MSESDDEPQGCEGTIVLATRGADGPGEVAISIRGGREIYIAYSKEPIAVGKNVLVVETRPARCVTVIAWPRLVMD
jgi:hypothetical protein